VPVFVDVDGARIADLDLCRMVLASDPGIRAMVPVHLYGHPLDLKALGGAADQFALTVVEDCAQAIGDRSLWAAGGIRRGGDGAQFLSH